MKQKASNLAQCWATRRERENKGNVVFCFCLERPERLTTQSSILHCSFGATATATGQANMTNGVFCLFSHCNHDWSTSTATPVLSRLTFYVALPTLTTFWPWTSKIIRCCSSRPIATPSYILLSSSVGPVVAFLAAVALPKSWWFLWQAHLLSVLRRPAGFSLVGKILFHCCPRVVKAEKTLAAYFQYFSCRLAKQKVGESSRRPFAGAGLALAEKATTQRKQ